MGKVNVCEDNVLHCVKTFNRGYCCFKAGQNYNISRIECLPGGDVKYYIAFSSLVGEVTLNSVSRNLYFK